MDDTDERDSTLAGRGAAFFRSRDFGGAPEYYREGDDVTFWEGDDFNDKYLSLKVTGKVKVYCYQHSYGNGIFRTFRRGDYADLSPMNGLSKFWIGPDRDEPPKPGPAPFPDPEPAPEPSKPHDWAFAFRVVDAVRNDDAEAERYEGRFAVAGLGTVSVQSEQPDVPDGSQRYVQLNGRGNIDQINCEVQLFHFTTNLLVAKAQVVFKYHATSGEVSIVKNVPEGLLTDVKVTQRDNTRFDVTLSLKEGVEPPQDLMRIERAVWDGTPRSFLIEGTGTEGAQVVATGGRGAAEKELTTVSGGRWRFEGGLPAEGYLRPDQYPDGSRRHRFSVAQRNSGVARARADILYRAPDIESPAALSDIGSVLPLFSGTAVGATRNNPWVLLTTEAGDEIGRSKVNEDGSWSMQPDYTAPPGDLLLKVQCMFPDTPVERGYKAEVKPFLLFVRT